VLRRTYLLTVTAILTLTIISLGSGVSAQLEKNFIEIYGTVYDVNGKIISNATVIVFDWATLNHTVRQTDSSGYYSISVKGVEPWGRHQYIIYVYHRDPRTGAIDYIPAVYPENIYAPENRVTESKEVSFRLHPGATVNLTGGEPGVEVWNIISLGRPLWYTFEVVIPQPNWTKPVLGVPYISVYGNAPYRYELAPDVRFIPLGLFNKSFREQGSVNVIVPAGVQVKIMGKAEIVNKRTQTREPISFFIDLNGQPFNLSQGELITIDVRTYSYMSSVQALKTLVADIEKRLVEAEYVGFFAGAEREDLQAISETIVRAELTLKGGTSEDLKEVRFKLLEAAYANIENLERRINDMYLLAQSHSIFFPPFFAVFMVVFASFLFENNRKKIITSLILYPLVVAALFYIYPGFTLVLKTIVNLNLLVTQIPVRGDLLFSSVTILSIVLTLAIFFLFPRIYKEPIVEGKAPLRNVVPVIFSIGKRNVKRRKLRSAFCILSIMILVLGFTALTSFSRVWGIVVEGPTTTTASVNGVLLQRPVPDKTSIGFFDLLEAESLKDYGAGIIVPKVENQPSDRPVLYINYSRGQVWEIYGVAGVIPSYEDRGVTQISSYITGATNVSQGIALSRTLADILGVSVGGSLQVLNENGKFYGSLKIIGFLDDSFFRLNDINGLPFTPAKFRGADVVRTNETETLVFTWTDIDQMRAFLNPDSRPSERLGISRIFVFLTDITGGKLGDFGNRMALKGYMAWVFESGKLTKYYTGEKFEVKGVEQFLIPFILVVLNVMMVMMNLLFERNRELPLLSTLGLNPAHIASLFLAESIVMGFIGGGLGYLLGLGSYRLMTLLGPTGQIGVREKLEWYWGVIGIGIALLVTVVSAIRPATRAAMMATPSMVKKVKLTEPEQREREKELFKVYTGRVYSMPIRVHEKEAPFFFSYLLDRLRELSGLHYERVEDLTTDEQVMTDGTRIIKNSFTYSFIEGRNQYSTINELTATKKPKTDYYFLSFTSKPKAPGIPEHAVEVTVTVMKDILLDWNTRKSQIMGLR